jgi:hypothetical protein
MVGRPPSPPPLPRSPSPARWHSLSKSCPGICDLENSYSSKLDIASVPMNFEEPAGTLTHEFYGLDGEVIDMNGVLFFRRMDSCNNFPGLVTNETQVGPNPRDASQQCFVFRVCYEDFFPNEGCCFPGSTVPIFYDSQYSNEIYLSLQEDGSLYWTYVSCYQVIHYQPSPLHAVW